LGTGILVICSIALGFYICICYYEWYPLAMKKIQNKIVRIKKEKGGKDGNGKSGTSGKDSNLSS
jgi:hypothetical protein